MPQKTRRDEEEEDADEVFNGGLTKLLGCDEVLLEEVEEKGCFSFSSSSSSSSSSSLLSMGPQMLHFGRAHEESFLSLMNRVMSSTDPCSPSPSPANDGKNNARSTTKKVKKVDDGRAETHGNNKRTRVGSNKGKQEKIGDRISALHKLVSPFGKADTATVLHETMGYIKFLHDQVQVLSSPYLQHPLSSYRSGEEAEVMRDLRSRGLCLVPISSAENIGGSDKNGWSPLHVQLSNSNSNSYTYTPSTTISGSKH